MHHANELTTISRRDLLNYAGAGAAALTLAPLTKIPTAEAQDMSNAANNF